MKGLLLGASAMLAMRMGDSDVELTEPEADAFLKAAQNVARHYSVETTQRTLDWVAFAGISAQVFGTRIVGSMVKRRRGGQKGEVVSYPNGAPYQAGPDIQPSVPAGPEFEH